MHKDDINKLALWQKIQRLNYHLGLLPQKKIDKLESIGGWDWDFELEPHTIKYLNAYKTQSKNIFENHIEFLTGYKDVNDIPFIRNEPISLGLEIYDLLALEGAFIKMFT